MALKPLLKIENLTFGYQFQPLVENLNFTIYREERIALIGPSGSGKSTLLKIMTGLMTPDKGSVFFENHNIHQMNPKELVATRKRMGLLFQKNALFDSMTANENITFSLEESSKLSKDQIQVEAQRRLDSVGLGHIPHLYPDELSGGMQKRLGIARAQALKPEILFYDDPTAGLDPITSRQIIELILSIQSECKSTILVVTNEIPRAYQVATRIFFLYDKQIFDLGSPQEAENSKIPFVRQFLRGETQGPLRSTL